MTKEMLAKRTLDIKAAAKIIADNMLKTRGKAEPAYSKRLYDKYITDTAPLAARCVDLKGIFPDAEKGDAVYVATILETNKAVPAVLKLTGCEKAFINNKEYEIGEDGIVEFDISEGQTLCELLCVCGDEFKMSFTPSICYYPGMWARDYLVHIKALSPIKEFEGQEGVGITAIGGERGVYVYPKKEEESGRVDFNKRYYDESGLYAYGISYAASDCEAEFNIWGKGKLFINNSPAKPGKVTLKKDDFVMIKCERDDKWGFEYSGDLYFPLLKGEKMLTVGAFSTSRNMDVKYGPELYLDYIRPYVNADGNRCFFMTSQVNSYMVCEMNTYFYAQWFYALMVGEYGLLDATKLTGCDSYQDYFIDSMSTMAEYYYLEKWHKETFGESAFMQRGMNPEDLDSIGSIGMNMCELYKLTQNPSALEIADMLAFSIKHIPRFDDKTFHRGATMWADDTYMSCPFMLRYGLLKGDKDYLEECASQLLGFGKKLFMDDKGLFSHIYFVNEKTPNRIPWGRGNGWVFVTLSELIEKLPRDTKRYDELVELYKKFAEGVINHQGENGLWHQVLDIPSSYEETSCTGMFIIGLCRGIRLGLLGEEVKEVINKAYKGLMENKIDKDGNVLGVCRGSWCSMEAKYYINLGTIDNDDHGTGIILSALYQMSML